MIERESDGERAAGVGFIVVGYGKTELLSFGVFPGHARLAL